MASIAEAKQVYLQRDLELWAKLAGVKLKWPDFFPLNSVLPLRVTLAAQCNSALISALCECLTDHFLSTEH